MSQLHGPAPEYARLDSAADVAYSSKKSMLRRAKPKREQQGSTGNAGGATKGPEDVLGTAADADALPGLNVAWTAVLWKRGLQHENLQVRGLCALHQLLKYNLGSGIRA